MKIDESLLLFGCSLVAALRFQIISFEEVLMRLIHITPCCGSESCDRQVQGNRFSFGEWRSARSGLLVALTVVSLLIAPCASAQQISRIFFFGDSLSDAGNHFIATRTSSRQPFSLDPPIASYDIGGHHFSDGATWAEQLATALQIPTSGNPSLRVPGVFTNYAVGRARSGAHSPIFSDFDLSTQVNEYLSDFAGQPPQPTDLFVIWIGANDVGDALTVLLTPPQLGGDPSGKTSAIILGNAVQAVATNLAKLAAFGAPRFLIANVPDLAKTPYIRFLGVTQSPLIPQFASLFSGFYNQGLLQVVGQNPLIRLLDTNALFEDILAAPENFGLSNTTDRCTTPLVQGNAICSQPHSYLFWDGFHPTTTTHTAIAQRALQVLSAP